MISGLLVKSLIQKSAIISELKINSHEFGTRGLTLVTKNKQGKTIRRWRHHGKKWQYIQVSIF